MIRTAAPAAAAGEGKADDAPAEETILTTPTDGVASWSTDKITPFAPAADQRIIVKEVGRPHWGGSPFWVRFGAADRNSRALTT